MRKDRWATLALVAGVGIAFAAMQGGGKVPGERPETQSRGATTTPLPIRAPASTRLAAAATPAYYTLSTPTPFKPLIEYDPGSFVPAYMESIALGDVTGDNRDDLVLAANNNPRSIWVVPQRPDRKMDWNAPRIFPFGHQGYSAGPWSLALGDLNEDGVLDIVCNGVDDTGQRFGFMTMLSDGKGGHSVRFNPHVFNKQWSQGVLADVDLDGHLDVIDYYPDADKAHRRVHFGDGRGGFPRYSATPLQGAIHVDGMETATPDLDNDGISDLVLMPNPTMGKPDKILQVYRNNRAGGYAAPVQYMPSGDSGNLDFGDFNRDGLIDIITNYWGGPSVYPQISPGVFGNEPMQLYFYSPFYPGFHAADLDLDGATDFVMGQFAGFDGGLWVQTYLQVNGALVDTPERPYLGLNETYADDDLVTGDLNGDGCTDVAVARSSDGVEYMFGQGCRRARTARNDFDGDHASDALWYDATTGWSDVWQGASYDKRKVVRSASSGWKLAGTGDFDDDGKTDLLWRHETSGANTIWRAANFRTPLAMNAVSDVAWKVAGIGDFNGDRKADILWRHATTGKNIYWPSGTGAAVTLTTVADRDWRVAAIGDFDGDGRDDLFWRHARVGTNAIWKSASPNGAVTPARLDLTWNVVGAGDFDGDGKSDVLWRKTTTGANVLWRSGNAAMATTLTATTSPGWQPAAIGDYDDDGRADIFWRQSTTGNNVLWLRGDSRRTRWVKSAGSRFTVVP
jgi:hypothetical protein